MELRPSGKSQASRPADSAPQPTLQTPRLWLRPMHADDLDDLLLIFGDPAVMAAFHSQPFDRAQMQSWLQRNLDHQTRYGFGLFAVIHKADGQLVGNCGLEMMETGEGPVAELGYDFRSIYWNQGLATEAACAVRDYAFQRLHLNRLISLIRVGNQASRRVAEKVGMQLAQEFTRGGIAYWQYELKRGER